MNNMNLILRFKLQGETDTRVVGATRIRVDGRGGLTLYPMQNGSPERISLERLQSLAIRPFQGSDVPVSA